MTLSDYQTAAMRTATPGDPKTDLAIAALGLVGEGGEVAELVKKHLGHGHPLDRDVVIKELGDVLWYIARLAALVGSDVEEVAAANVAKLLKRYPAGFSSEASMARVDVPK